MELKEKKRLCQNWRGRRFLACRLIGDLEDVIANLGDEDGSQLPLPDGMPTPPTKAMRAEMQNTARNLLRLILLHNDGQVSPARLQGF